MKTINIILFVLISAAGCSASQGFLKAKGTDLYLDGKEYREIGFNKYDLLHQSIFCPEEEWQTKNKQIVTRDLEALHQHGFKIVRFMACPYFAIDYDRYFFHRDKEIQIAKREIYFKRFDRILDLCDQYDIKVIPSLIWWNAVFADLGGHSIHEGIINPQSAARQKIKEYITAVVSRYKDRTTIAMWELGNEWNLEADLQLNNGVIRDYAHNLTPSVVVRDGSNNFTSEELAEMVQQLAELIKSIDKNHLVTTGHSSPRPAAMHLLRAALNIEPVDWTRDNRQELIEYIQLSNPDPIDIISIHYYEEAFSCFDGNDNMSTRNIKSFMQTAQKIGKPLMIGEIGMYKKMPDEIEDYRKPGCLPYIESCLQEIVKNKIPLTLYWTYHDSVIERGEQHWSLEYGKTDEILKRIEQANRDIKK